MDYSRLTQVIDGTFNRLLDLLNTKTCAIITAYRLRGDDGKKLTKEQNIARNRELRGILNKNKMGVYQLIGHWQEAPDGMNYHEAEKQNLLNDTIERSYAVLCPEGMSEEKFLSFMMDCMTIDGLTQDSIVFHNADGFFLVYNDGTMESLGKNCTLNKISQAYSQSVLKSDVPFVFDSVRQPNGNSDKIAMQKQGLLWFSEYTLK